jgi:cytochrome c553
MDRRREGWAGIAAGTSAAALEELAPMKPLLLLAAVLVACAAVVARAQDAVAKPDLAKAQSIVNQVCSACHGADGNSPTAVNPSLAGQPAMYITLQLAHFKAGVRSNPVMQGMAAALSPEDMRALGEFFSQQAPKPMSATDATLVKAGQKLYRGGDSTTGVPACAACHAPTGAGIPKNYPRLAGQHTEYTYAQLKAFKAGERGADKDGKDVNGRTMATIAGRMTDAQMKAAAEYTTGLR